MPGAVPPELLIGPLAEVWAEDGADLLDARRRYGIARRAREASTEVERPTSYALLPATAPWRLTDPGGTARLARIGVSADRLPELRAVTARVATHDHRRTT